MTQSMSAVLGGRRRRTDLLPTIPVHRDSDRSPRSHASSSSRGSVSRSTGMSVSLSRLDQLSRPAPRRRLTSGQLTPLHENADASPSDGNAATNHNRTRASTTGRRTLRPSVAPRSMSKSMSHLPATKPERKADAPATVERQQRARRTPSSGGQKQQPPRPGATSNGGWPHARPIHALTAWHLGAECFLTLRKAVGSLSIAVTDRRFEILAKPHNEQRRRPSVKTPGNYRLLCNVI